MNAPDSNTRPTTRLIWDHFDGQTPGSLRVGERQYLMGEYTFGVSDKCKITLKCTNLVITGLTGKAGNVSFSEQELSRWLVVRTADNLNRLTIGSQPPLELGYAHPATFEVGNGLHETADENSTGVRATANLMVDDGPLRTPDCYDEITTLEFYITRVPLIAWELKMSVSSGLVIDEPLSVPYNAMVDTNLIVYCGDVPLDGPGITSMTVLEFSCVDVA